MPNDLFASGPKDLFATGPKDLFAKEDAGSSFMDKAIGAGEAGLNATTGLLSQFPAAVGAGLDTANKVLSGRYQESDPGQMFSDISNKLTYSPRTEEGKSMSEDLATSGFMQSLNAAGAVAHTMPPIRTAPSIRSQVRAGTDLNIPKISGALDALDAAKTPKDIPAPEAVKPPISNMAQTELPDSAMIQAPQYGVHEGVGRLDEHGIPIRADLSMEAQNMENPLQRNLWGDELGPAQGQERGLTDAIDQMGKGVQRNIAMKQLGKNAPDLISEDMTNAQNVADNQFAPREGPFSLPESQRGAIEINGSGESKASLEAQSRLQNKFQPPKGQRGAIDTDVIKAVINSFKYGTGRAIDILDAFKGAFEPKELDSAKAAMVNPKGQDTIVLMSPDQFHSLAAGRSPAEMSKMAEGLRGSIREGLKSEGGLHSIPYLKVDGKGQVVGHEGRHRMDVFKEQGIEQVPVRIRLHDTLDNKLPTQFYPEDAKNLSGAAKEIFAQKAPKSVMERPTVAYPQAQRGGFDLEEIKNGLAKLIGQRVETEKGVGTVTAHKVILIKDQQKLLERLNQIHDENYKGDTFEDRHNNAKAAQDKFIKEEYINWPNTKPTGRYSVRFANGNEDHFVLGPDIKKVFTGPKSQQGALNFKDITDTVTNAVERIGSRFRMPFNEVDAIGKQPGMGKAAQDLIYVPEAGAVMAEKARGEVDGPPLWKDFQSGLDHASEKTNSTLMKGTAQWLQYARRNADFGDRTVVRPLEKMFSKLSKNEMIDLMEVTKREMFNRKQYTMDELKGAGLNDRQLATYEKFRAAQKEVLDIQNKGRVAQGKEPITPQNAYLSSVFQGDYHIAVKDVQGNLKWYIQNPTRGHANKAIAWLKENAPEGVDTSKLKVEYKPRPFQNVPRDVMGAYQDAMKMFPPDDPVVQRIQSIMQEYTQQRGNQYLAQNLHHSATKENIRGFTGDQPWLSPKENAYGLAKAQISYMKNAYQWAHMQEALSQVKEMISDPMITEKQPNNMELTKNYVLNNMGVSKNMLKGVEQMASQIAGKSSSMVPGFVRDLKGLAYMAQLGASVGYMIATPLQLIPGLAAWHTQLGLSMKNFYKDLPFTISDGMLGLYHDIGKDIATGVGKSWDSTTGMTKFGRDAYRWGEANGVFNTNIFDENAGLGAHKALAQGKNMLGYTISKPDQMSRWIAFLSFARHLEGTMPKDQVFQRAAELTEHVATDMHRTSRPLIVDKFGAIGEGSYMYKAPQINMLNTLSLFARKAAAGDPKPFLMYLATMGVMGGLLNLPGVQEADGAWNILKDGVAKYKPEWYKHIENTGIKETVLSHFSDNSTWGQIASWGAASTATGANMASRFNQGVVDVEHPMRGIAPLGQELYEQKAIGEAALNPNRDTIAQALHINSPPAVKGLLETNHPSFKSGTSGPGWTGYRNPNDVTNTATFVKRSPEEEKMKAFGLTALSEAQRRTKDYVANVEQGRVKTAQQEMLDKMFNAMRRNDSGDIEKYAKGYFQLHGDMDKFSSDIMQKVERLGMTPAEFQKTHINGINSLNAVMRRISMNQGNK